MLKLLLNLLWIVFGGGFVIAIEYALAGLVLCLTVIGIPFGVQCFKLAGVGLLPFGKEFVASPTGGPGTGVLGVVFNVLWFLLAGLWIFLTHVALGLYLAVTVIGIPFAVQHFKLAFLALWPFGRELREAY